MHVLLFVKKHMKCQNDRRQKTHVEKRTSRHKQDLTVIDGSH